MLVIGGGPAGAQAARAAAAAGARVLLVEKKRRAGALPHCAEFAPRLLGLEVAISARARVQEVAGMETHLTGGGEAAFLPGPGWILDRQVFDHDLVLTAATAGAEVWAATRFLGFAGERALLARGRDQVEVGFGAAVAADGAASPAARAAGLSGLAVVAGLQWEVPLARPLTRTQIYLDPTFRPGYAWLFPKGRAANLGLGCLAGLNPPRLLEGFRQRLLTAGVILPGILAITGGAIAVGGPRPQPFQGRLLLAGDAAGLTHPVSGAGIPQAVFAGALAGAAAARLAGGKAGAAEDYATELAGRYGAHLAHGLALRHEMEAGWDGPDFVGLMARIWPGLGGGRRGR